MMLHIRQNLNYISAVCHLKILSSNFADFVSVMPVTSLAKFMLVCQPKLTGQSWLRQKTISVPVYSNGYINSFKSKAIEGKDGSPVQLTRVFTRHRIGAVRNSVATQRASETRPCWRTSAGPLSTRCRCGRTPLRVMAASAPRPSSAHFLMVRNRKVVYNLSLKVVYNRKALCEEAL